MTSDNAAPLSPQESLRRARRLLMVALTTLAVVTVVCASSVALDVMPVWVAALGVLGSLLLCWREFQLPAMQLMAASMQVLEEERVKGQQELAARGELEGKLRKQAERYDVAMKAAAMGVWDWDIQQDKLEYDSHQLRLFGVEPGPGVDADWRKRVYPEDLPAVEASIRRALQGDMSYAIDFRVRRDDGQSRWLHGMGVLIRDTTGRPLRLVGVNIDVTARHQAEDQRRDMDVRLREVAASLEEAQALARVGSWSFDLTSGAIDWSRQMYALLGRDPSLPVPSYPDVLSDYEEASAAWLEAAVQRAAADGTPYRGTLRLKRPKNGVEIVQAEAKVTLGESGKPLRLFGTLSDITANVQREDELKRARVQAEAANRAKSEFLANMSHEIRTPMAAILGYIDLIADPRLPKEQFREYGKTIQRNASHLLDLINQVLDLSKIEAGRMTVERITCSPEALVREILSLLTQRADEKELTLSARFEGLIPAVIQTDPTRLRQILLNLVGNAIKFTEHGGVEIILSLDMNQAEPQLEFRVEDTGIGMDPVQLSQLFRPFSQGDTSITRRFGGTGLGLSIVSHLARLLGGSIDVISTKGVGTMFTVRVATGALDAVALVQYAGDRARNAPSSPMPPANRPSIGIPLMGLRVLLVEDGLDNQRLISLHLTRGGAQVEVLANGQLAVDRLTSAHAQPVDVVLMDMQMPVLDGYTATAKLRSMGYTGPIVALTAHAMEGDRQKCLQAGCDDYATKPIESRFLVRLILTHAKRQTHEVKTRSREEPLVMIVSEYHDDPDMAELVAQFVDSLGARISEVEGHFDRGEWDKLARIAHQLKGAGGGYGFPQISTAAQGLEQACRDAVPPAKLRESLDALLAIMRAAQRAESPPTAADVTDVERPERAKAGRLG